MTSSYSPTLTEHAEKDAVSKDNVKTFLINVLITVCLSLT